MRPRTSPGPTAALTAVLATAVAAGLTAAPTSAAEGCPLPPGTVATVATTVDRTTHSSDGVRGKIARGWAAPCRRSPAT